MTKLRLEVDTLNVSSFPTLERPAEPGGTVRANEATAGISCHTSCAGGGPCTCHPG
jgi:hypothetical protein